MKLKRLLYLMDNDEKIRVFDDTGGTYIFDGTVSKCYQNRKLINRKVTFFFPSGYRIEVFVR